MTLDTNWMWLPGPAENPDCGPDALQEPMIVYFRKAFTVDEEALKQTHTLRISADSRYKLYVNGQFVQDGPQKATDLKQWYVDEACITEYLQAGENVLALEVLRYPPDNFSRQAPNTNASLYRTNVPGVYVESVGETLPVSGRSGGYKACHNGEIRVYGEDARPAPIHIQEEIHATGYFHRWKELGYDDSGWADARCRSYLDTSAADAPWNLIPRTIPAMRHSEGQFQGVSAVRESAAQTAESLKEQYEKMLRGEGRIEIPANTPQIVELDAGEETCGYLKLAFAGGGGACVRVLCAECYGQPEPDERGGVRVIKGDRTDAKHGSLTGHSSVYYIAGCGSPEAPEVFAPFWWRTFRYVRLEITTHDQGLTVLGADFLRTGYPLDVVLQPETDDQETKDIWDICVRTLQLCMHETYMDCPFYEQLQYAMDSRSEILYTYAISGDDRLARQAIEAFRLSQRPDGLIHADAPCISSNVIPSFSIYYILMVYDHMMYFGDRDLVSQYLPSVDQVLSFFDRHRLPSGLVGKVGGPIMRERYWSFIDWTAQWDPYAGVPGATVQGDGAITAESLLYTYGLQKAAELAAFVGHTEQSHNYLSRAADMQCAIRDHCLGDCQGTLLVQDGPGLPDYSVHAQVLGVLTHTISPEDGRRALAYTVGHPDCPQASVAFMFYLFRAFEQVGAYDRTQPLWDLWRKMLDNKLTTCVENGTDERSDCHAWGSLMCYEYPASFLGVRPTAPGFAHVRIAPLPNTLPNAGGTVPTPRGPITVRWQRDETGQPQLRYTLPEGVILDA